MSILRVNLKHLYQKRSLWFVGLFFGGCAFGVIMIIGHGEFSAPVLWMFFLSALVATVPIDVLTKPFSYCLPKHRNVPRRFLFFIGLMLSLLWSLAFLFYPGLSIVGIILACLSAFSMFTMSYWLGAWVVFKFRNWSVVFAILPLMILGNTWLNMSTLIEQAIVESPLLMIFSGGLVNYLAWGYWGRSNLARQYCGRLWMGAFDAWNPEKMSKYKLAKLAEKDKKKPNSVRISSGVERFFIWRISGATTDSLRPYIWGSFYKTFGMMISQQRQYWMRSLIIILPILCFLCYLPGKFGKIMVFFMPGIMVVNMSLWVHSSLSVSGGRLQRFWSALSLGVATGILVTVAVMLFAMATHLLERIMPQLTIRGHEFTFGALTIYLSIVPLLMIPVSLAIGLIFQKHPILKIVFIIILFQIAFVSNVLRDPGSVNWPVQIGPMHVVIMLLCSWGVFIGVLRYISMRCCLVSQTK